MIEHILHQKYFNDRKVGEWFDLDADAVFSFKDECNKVMDNVEALKDNPFFKKYMK